MNNIVFDLSNQDQIYEYAKKVHEKGFSPICLDPATKKPSCVGWDIYRAKQCPIENIDVWAAAGMGLGVAIGYGGLEVFDFDVKDKTGHVEEVREELRDKWLDDLHFAIRQFDLRFPIVCTPSGGRHIWTRTYQGAKKQNLAGLLNGVLIEIPGQVAIKGNYKLLNDVQLFETGWIEDEERELIFKISKEFNRIPKREYPAHSPHAADHWENYPGTIFNEQHSLEEILIKHGWTHMGGTYWARPGVSHTSAQMGEKGLFVYSASAAPLEADTLYGSAFAIEAFYNFDGDFHAAASALAIQGYARHAWRLNLMKNLTKEF